MLCPLAPSLPVQNRGGCISFFVRSSIHSSIPLFSPAAARVSLPQAPPSDVITLSANLMLSFFFGGGFPSKLKQALLVPASLTFFFKKT
jgi:hypothetical protein